MLIYADGTALSRFVVDSPTSLAWRCWGREHGHALVTSEWGLSELRRAVAPLGAAERAAAHGVAERTTVVRYSDQMVDTAAMASSVLPPFSALHLAVAICDPEVGSIATYDKLLAQVAEIYDVPVASPGLPAGWWRE